MKCDAIEQKEQLKHPLLTQLLLLLHMVRIVEKIVEIEKETERIGITEIAED